MRKCDICDTRIPFGEDRCPNCGFPYKAERKLSGEVREAKKEQYMSQFKPHPSPLDDLKKGEIPDFSKVYDNIKGVFNRQTTNKQPTKNVTINKPRRKNTIILIPILIVSVIVGLTIAGITYGFTQVFNEFNSDDFHFVFDDFDSFFDDFNDLEMDDDYGWYHSGDELENMYPDVYAEIKPYYSHMYNYQNDTNSFEEIVEMYGVEYGELYYANIGTTLIIDHSPVYASLYYSDGRWYELYQADKYLGNNLPLANDIQVVNGLAYLTQIEPRIIEDFLTDFTEDSVEGITYKYIYSDDGGTFYFYYSDGYMHYEYENIIEISE